MDRCALPKTTLLSEEPGMNFTNETGGVKVTFTYHWYDPGVRHAQDLFRKRGV